MWIEKTNKGHFKYVETYKCPFTGKTKRISKTYEKNNRATQKQAEKYLTTKIAKLISRPESLTYNEALCIYLKSITVKKSTLNIKTNVLKSLAKYFHDGNILLDMVTSAYIRDFYLNSDIYIPRGYMDILKTFFNWCYKNDYIETKVFDKVTLKEQRHNPGYSKKFFEKKEILEILHVLDKHTYYSWRLTRLVVEFITLTGLRIGEVSALRYSDVDGKMLSVNKSAYQGVEDTPKTKKSIRTIPINSRVLQIINEMRLVKRIHGIESDLIFPNTAGDFISPQTCVSVLRNAGIKPARIHIYRHTHASILAESGVPLDAIQRRLGHGDDKVTKEIYIHMTERMKHKENNFFEALEIL